MVANWALMPAAAAGQRIMSQAASDAKMAIEAVRGLGQRSLPRLSAAVAA
jgi:hypothetical protein